ncbi:MAG: helix-turn-helix domain-containing protein, partial [Clostridia bacterium]|nr:helix-turn-helix domain-containing protein [Clostridia bacterium]
MENTSEAIRHLLETAEPIPDIACACGFTDTRQFTEIFTENTGMTPEEFRTVCDGITLHPAYDDDDVLLAVRFGSARFLAEEVRELSRDCLETNLVHEPDDTFGFLHEAAIVEYHGVLYTAWYNCPRWELSGYTPICEKRSRDGGRTWSGLRIVCEDPTEQLLSCPPVGPNDADRLYMLVNQMRAPDHIHSQ